MAEVGPRMGPEGADEVGSLPSALDLALLKARRREKWLAATTEVINLLAESESTTEAMQAIADSAKDLSGADVAWVVAGEQSQLKVQVVSGAPFDPDALARLDLRRSLARIVAESGTTSAVDDMVDDPRVLDLAGQLGWPRLGPAAMVPLVSRAGISGVLALAWRRENRAGFAQLDPALPARFAEQAALALEIGRSRRRERLLALFEDRERIARDLHDLVIQRLFAAGLSLESSVRPALRAEDRFRLDTVVDELDATIKDIRRTIFALGSMEETGTDLHTEIVRLVDRAAGILKFRPHLDVSGPLRTLVDDGLAPEVLAVLGELLSNAARHSKATAVDVALSVDSMLTLRVSDNGHGLPGTVAESGLVNVRARAERLGGRCVIDSAPGRGTCVTWRVPLHDG